MSKLSFVVKGVALAVAMVGSMSAQASTGGFVCAGTTSCDGTGSSVLSWSLSDAGLLTISNALQDGNQSFIAGVSFEVGSGDSVSFAGTTGDVSFQKVTKEAAHLPTSLGWNVDYSMAALKPSSKAGVNAGESISFQLSGVSLAELGTPDFRFAVKLQGTALDGKGSEKLVAVVPEPSSYALVLAGLAVAGGLSRRRRGN